MNTLNCQFEAAKAVSVPVRPLRAVRVITIPNGQRVTLGEYVKAWRLLKSLPPQEELNGWQWWATNAGAILADFSFAVHDRINLRGDVCATWGRRVDPISRLARRIQAGKIERSCKWCGQSFKPSNVNQSCCSDDCRRSYNL